MNIVIQIYVWHVHTVIAINVQCSWQSRLEKINRSANSIFFAEYFAISGFFFSSFLMFIRFDFNDRTNIGVCICIRHVCDFVSVQIGT